MSDLFGQLPLSNKPRRDESGVTADRSALVASTLDALAALVDGLDDEKWARSADAVRALAGPVTTAADAASALRARAAAVPGRTRTKELAEVVVGAFAAASAAGLVLAVDPLASGAVAVAGAARSRLAIRSILGSSSLVATDADWRVGRGAPVASTAQAIVLFLYGRGPFPATSSST